LDYEQLGKISCHVEQQSFKLTIKENAYPKFLIGVFSKDIDKLKSMLFFLFLILLPG